MAYGPRTQRTMKKIMGEFKQGKLRSGRTNRKVASRRQAVAIGLSEARREGSRVPRRSRGTTQSRGDRSR